MAKVKEMLEEIRSSQLNSYDHHALDNLKTN